MLLRPFILYFRQYGKLWSEVIKSIYTHFNLGIAYKKQGHVAEARRELEIAAQLGYEPAQKLLRAMGQR